MSVTETIETTTNTCFIRLRKSEKIYKQGEYMSSKDKKAYYVKNGGIAGPNEHNKYMLMPDRTWYWLLSEKDICAESLALCCGGD